MKVGRLGRLMGRWWVGVQVDGWVGRLCGSSRWVGRQVDG